MTTKKSNKPANRQITRRPSKILVLFGLCDDGTARAARFPDDDQSLVAKTAKALSLRMGVATKTAHFEIVQKLPIGKLNAPGGAAVPKVDKAVYQQLNNLVGGEVGRIAAKLPKSADEVGPGHLVLAQESIMDGWFEAVCVARQGKRVVVRWRDYPTIPPFERDISDISLPVGE